MAIMPIIQNDVISIIKNLKVSSPGWDSISAVVVKATYACFIEPLTHILNLSIMHGVFPWSWNWPRLFLYIKRMIPCYSLIIDQSQFCQCSQKYMRELCITSYCPLWTNTSYYISINLDFVWTMPQNWHYYAWLIKYRMPWRMENTSSGYFLISPRHSILLIMIFYLQNWNF